MSRRKLDESVPQLYRVVTRATPEDEWEPLAQYNRTYQTLGAARGMRTRLANERGSWFAYTGSRTFSAEFAVQVAPVGDWELVT